MGLNIDDIYHSESSVNLSSIHNTLDNFHSLLLLYDEFDHSIQKLEILHCSKILLSCYTKLADTIGSGFNDTEFRMRYTSIAMNTFTVFNSLNKDEDYITNALTQYFSTNSATSNYLDSIVSGSQNILEIYENVLKDVTISECSDLGNKMTREYYKKCEIFIKVLYWLTHHSFQMLGKNSDYNFSVRLSNTLDTQLSLYDLVDSYNNLGIFNHFMELFENYCDNYLDFKLPDYLSEKSHKLAQEFNINLHVKLYCNDTSFYESLKREILVSLESVEGKLKILDKYIKEVSFLYSNFDFSSSIQLNQFYFDDTFLQEFYTRLVGGFYDDFCENLSLLLPLVDAIELIERFRTIAYTNLKYHQLNYFETYLQISLRNWENQLLNYVRSLSLNQYPHISPVNTCNVDINNHNYNTQDAVVTNDYFVKYVNFNTIMEAYNTYLSQFMSLVNSEHSGNELRLTQSLNFLNNLQSCYISNNLCSIVMIVIKLSLLPIILNHELTEHLSADKNSPDRGPEANMFNRNRMIKRYIQRNSKLMQNIVLLYLFNSNTSFKDFLYSICKLDKGLQGLQEILSVFVIYVSNVYYINSLVTLIPYLIQCSYFIYSGNCDKAMDNTPLLGIIRSNYRVSVIRISLYKLQDYLIAHMSAFNQQYIQKLVSNSLSMLHHTSSESYGNELLNYLATFVQILSKYLPHEIYKSVLAICIDLTYNCIIFETLDFFEGINYKFNQQLFFKIKLYIESITYSINLQITNGIDLELTYDEKFQNFLKIFNDYNGVNDNFYGHNEFSKINKLIRHLKSF